MINSDNVVRGGLTPKHKDTKTLLELLDFQTLREFDIQKGQELYNGPEKCSLL
jgi:mannose-6-phosphate isomerase class I